MATIDQDVQALAEIARDLTTRIDRLRARLGAETKLIERDHGLRCSQCGAGFRGEVALDDHLANVHGIDLPSQRARVQAEAATA